MSTRHRRTQQHNLPDLRPLDSAPDGAGDRAAGPAAQELLSRIVSTPRRATGTSAGRPAQGPTARRRPLALAGAAVAVVAVAAGVIIAPTGSSGSGTAYASWTPVPAEVAPAEAAQLQAECLSAGRDLGQGGDVEAAFSEQRGEFAFTLVATDAAVGSCMVLDPPPTASRADEERGASSWGSTSDLPLPPAEGTSVQWGASFRSAAGEFTSAIGRTGIDVVAVDFTSDDEPAVQARVEQGWFTAWWPGGPDDELTVTTTLRDGTRSSRTLETGEI